MENGVQAAPNIGAAIEQSEALDAIFVGGSITSHQMWSNGQPGWAHVGRIDLSTRLWVWQKQFAEEQE